MPRSRSVSVVVPFGIVLAGLVGSILRFRAEDPLGGLALGLSGLLLMLVAATWLSPPD